MKKSLSAVGTVVYVVLHILAAVAEGLVLLDLLRAGNLGLLVVLLLFGTPIFWIVVHLVALALSAPFAVLGRSSSVHPE